MSRKIGGRLSSGQIGKELVEPLEYDFAIAENCQWKCDYKGTSSRNGLSTYINERSSTCPR
jgi:hypothetical protein